MSAFAGFIDRFNEALPDQLQLIEKLSQRHVDDHIAIIKAITERHLLPHTRMCQLWGDSIGKAFVNPFEVRIPSGEGAQLPRKVATIGHAIVLNTLKDTATVGMADPINERLIASFKKILGKEVSPVFSHPDDIAAVIDLHFTNEKTLAASLQKACDNLPTLEGGREIESEEDADALLQGESFNELFNSILFTAFGRKASDIHFEVDVSEGRVRMRIDGRLTQDPHPPALGLQRDDRADQGVKRLRYFPISHSPGWCVRDSVGRQATRLSGLHHAYDLRAKSRVTSAGCTRTTILPQTFHRRFLQLHPLRSRARHRPP